MDDAARHAYWRVLATARRVEPDLEQRASSGLAAAALRFVAQPGIRRLAGLALMVVDAAMRRLRRPPIRR